MTNLHYIADEQLGGVEREYAEVERKASVGDLVIYDGKVREVTYVGLTAMSLDARIHIVINVMLTLDPTGNVRIDGTVYRMVDRNAGVGEKVLITRREYTKFGEVFTVSDIDLDGDYEFAETLEHYAKPAACSVLEPIDQAPADDLTQSDDLSLTEADVRDNPRQVVDLIANLALRVTTLEKGADRLSKLESKVARLGTANQQAYDIVARNVETWAQEIETIKARMGDAGRALTADERREL
jgi:hypothetical protein